MKRLNVLLLAGLIGVISWGCSSSDREQEVAKETHITSPNPGKNDKRIEEKTPREFEGLHVVKIKGMKFIPQELSVSKGDTVVWVNEDISIHDVAEELTEQWKSPELKKGEHWKQAINETTEYYCTLHKVMKGKITIK